MAVVAVIQWSVAVACLVVNRHSHKKRRNHLQTGKTAYKVAKQYKESLPSTICQNDGVEDLDERQRPNNAARHNLTLASLGRSPFDVTTQAHSTTPRYLNAYHAGRPRKHGEASDSHTLLDHHQEYPLRHLAESTHDKNSRRPLDNLVGNDSRHDVRTSNTGQTHREE